MEGHEQIDDLFRKTLEGQRIEPAKNLWRGINRKLLLREMTRFNFSNLPGTLWISGIAGIVIIPMILYLTLYTGKISPSNPNFSKPSKITPERFLPPTSSPASP